MPRERERLYVHTLLYCAVRALFIFIIPLRINYLWLSPPPHPPPSVFLKILLALISFGVRRGLFLWWPGMLWKFWLSERGNLFWWMERLDVGISVFYSSGSFEDGLNIFDYSWFDFCDFIWNNKKYPSQSLNLSVFYVVYCCQDSKRVKNF